MEKKSNANVSSRYHLTCRLSMSATAFSLMTSKDSWWSGSGPSPDFLFYSLNHISWFSKVHMDVVQPGVSANHVSTHLRIRIRGKRSRRSMASKLNHRFNPGHRCRSKQPQNYLHLSGSLLLPPVTSLWWWGTGVCSCSSWMGMFMNIWKPFQLGRRDRKKKK